MSVTLEKLFIKAEQKGESNKNGRITEYDFGHVYKSDLQEQWHVVNKSGRFELRHWGTTILETVNGVIKDIYGESVSDRDALNFTFNYLDLPYHVHYYPSCETLELHSNDEEKIIKSI